MAKPLRGDFHHRLLAFSVLFSIAGDGRHPARLPLFRAHSAQVARFSSHSRAFARSQPQPIYFHLIFQLLADFLAPNSPTSPATVKTGWALTRSVLFPFKEPSWQLPVRSTPIASTRKNPRVLAPPKAKPCLLRTLSNPASTPIPNSATARSAPISIASGSSISPVFRPNRPKNASRSIRSSAMNGRSAGSSAPKPTFGNSTPPTLPAATAPPSAKASTIPAPSSCACTAASPSSKNPTTQPSPHARTPPRPTPEPPAGPPGRLRSPRASHRRGTHLPRTYRLCLWPRSHPVPRNGLRTRP